MSSAREVIAMLKSHANKVNVAGMARFGIKPAKALGLTIPYLRRVAKECGADHDVAGSLWESGYHEARILASMIDRPFWVTRRQMNAWVADMDSWDVADQCCLNLFHTVPFAVEKAMAWSRDQREYVKRCGFVITAVRAVHMKDQSDDEFRAWFDVIIRESRDDRIYVRKAVNWCLRQIGKRNPVLRREAIACARLLIDEDASASSRWIGRDALRELVSTLK